MTEPSDTSSGYWYGQERRTTHAVDVLNALRRYRRSETAMRRRTRESMKMGETDLLALQFLLRRSKEDVPVGPRDLSTYLQISSASTTVLIDRLVRSGHVERRPHPTDRRALLLVPTVATDDEVRQTLGQMHKRMLAAAETLHPDELETVVRFLDSMRNAVDAVDVHDAHDTHGPASEPSRVGRSANPSPSGR
ncbi:MarR family transcriptional regulator [Labedella populi]|uniref:MarR family transcriptional regulator n=1 Tax=Labedella populi TaxID=2498850 RepID=A0A3S4DYM8_9MICO|nr:MarR family transcriptional regulator [Labedella populi]RWZ59180.1 MarR family transcriptional regulator [Labedella populi]